MFGKIMITCLIGTLLATAPVSAQTVIPGGDVSGTWDAAASPYLIEGEITVPLGETLNIESGVEVSFQGHYKLIVNGFLEAVGTEIEPILFTAADTEEGWHSIRFIDAPDTSHLTYCIVQYGKAIGVDPNDTDGWGGGIFIEGSNPEIAHSTIRWNSANHYDGGISVCYGSNPTINHCLIEENTAGAGGGIGCYFASETVTHCTISGNTTTTWNAGGMYVNESSATISFCTITGNSSSPGYIAGGISIWPNATALVSDCVITDNNAPEASGGGIFIGENSNPTIERCTISGNTANVGGGILISTQCSPTITGNTISGNASSYTGGGITIQDDCQPVITNNSFTSNSALYGGGIYCWAGYEIQPPTINNNIFAGNSADIGGALSLNRCYAMTLSNNTITENTSDSWGAGIECYWSSLVMINTILWDNTAPIGPEIWVGFNSAELTISYSDVQDGHTLVYVEPGSTLNWGAGMIDEDPLFETGPDGDYYLRQDPCQPGVVNPCVNWGNPFSPMIAGTTRTDCAPDVGRVDMGYHYALPDTVLDTVTADLGCVPDSGVLPLATQFSVTLGNSVAYDRTVAGRIDLTTAGGTTYQSWRAGFTNLGPNETFVTTWMQTLPALGSLVGSNVFALRAEDVTPPPFNQPPYPPAGDTDTSTVTVMATAP